MKLELRPTACIIVVFLILVGISSPANAQDRSKNEDHPEFEIWPEGIPAGSFKFDDAKIAKLKAKQTEQTMTWVDRPTLTVYQPETGKSNGCAVVICPGGGYNVLAWPKEGLELGEWFSSFGVTAFVLKYRVPRRTKRIHWEPMQDVQRAIRVVRRDAKKWEIDPDRIGTLGFSAGGHLAVMSGVQFDTKSYERVDDADQLTARPDFMCLIYAAYLGDGYRDDVVELGELITVSKKTPPAFLAVTWDDRMRGAQAALLFARLKEHGVKAELHAYASGGHGYAIRPTGKPISKWNDNLKDWMKSTGLLKGNSKIEESSKTDSPTPKGKRSE